MSIENQSTESKPVVVAKMGENNYTQKDLNDLFFAFALHGVHKNTGINFNEFACMDTLSQSSILSTLSNYEHKKQAVEKHREHLDKETPDANTSKPFVGEAYNASNQYNPNIPPWLHPNEIPSWAKGVSNNQPGFGRATGAPNINMMTLHDSLRTILVCLPMNDPNIVHSCFDFQGRTMTVNQALNYIYGAIRQFHPGAITGNKF